MSEAEGEGFLSRWSRRKREAAAAPEPPVAEAAEPATDTPADPLPAAGPVEAAAPRQAACRIPNLPEIDLSSLPSIEELTAQSDFSLFLRPGIPQALRNAALRRMWSLDPAIRDYIGPVEYQWDFNTPGGLPLGFASELGGDVGRLLAQAIGKLDDVANPPLPRVEEHDGEAMPEAIAPSDPLGALVPEHPLAPSPSLASIESAEPPVEAPAPPRRRHGGALPR